MQRTRHVYSVKVEMELTLSDLRILRDSARSHYDAACQAEAEEVGNRGALVRLREKMRNLGEPPTITTLLDISQLDLWVKIMESPTNHEEVALYASLRTALIDAIGEQERLNKR